MTTTEYIRWLKLLDEELPFGGLVDADALNFNADYNEPLISKRDFDFAPTIIEAD